MLLTSFGHFLTCIPQARLLWEPDSDLEAVFVRVCGDLVQAMQALKECRPTRSEELRNRLLELRRALAACELYSAENIYNAENLSSPFTRALSQVNDALFGFFPSDFMIMHPIRGFPEHVVEPSTPESAIWRPENTAVDYTSLGTMVIPRLFNGLWQLSSPAWGSAAPSRAYTALGQLVSVGLSATDMADHYVCSLNFIHVISKS